MSVNSNYAHKFIDSIINKALAFNTPRNVLANSRINLFFNSFIYKRGQYGWYATIDCGPSNVKIAHSIDIGIDKMEVPEAIEFISKAQQYYSERISQLEKEE